MATDAQTAVIRSWIGTTATIPTDIDDRLTRLGTAEAVALELLRERRAELLAGPSSVAVDGDVTVNWGDTIAGLEKLIAELEQIVGPDATSGRGVTISSIVRPSTRWRPFYRY